MKAEPWDEPDWMCRRPLAPVVEPQPTADPALLTDEQLYRQLLESIAASRRARGEAA